MRKVPAFWDASALVPLCVHERVSRQAHSCVSKFALVAWWGSVVEIHVAISRLPRSGVLNDLEKTGALTRLSVLSRSWGRFSLTINYANQLAICWTRTNCGRLIVY